MTVHDPVYEQKIQEALQSADSQESAPVDIIEFSTGVKLKYIGVSILRIQNITSHFKEPKVPEIFDEERNRMIQAPNERWVRECELVKQQQGLAVLDAIIAMGTQLEYVPAGIPKLEEDAWLQDLIEFSFVEVPEKLSEKGRYLLWVKYVAMQTQEDFEIVPTFFNKAIGVSEQQVANAMADNFPDN